MRGCTCGGTKHSDRQCEGIAEPSMQRLSSVRFLMLGVCAQTRPSQPGILAAEKPRSAKLDVQNLGSLVRDLESKVSQTMTGFRDLQSQMSEIVQLLKQPSARCCRKPYWLSEAEWLASHMSQCSGRRQSVMPLPACARLVGLKRTRLAGRWAKRARRFLLKSSAQSL